MRDIVERFTADVVLTDGSLVRVRPVHDDDRPLLIEFLKTLSRDTRYLRFFRAGVDPETEVDYLMPGEKGFALLATREGRVIGHAAYARSGPGKAEAGIVVADAYQGKGLGTLLLGHITQAAGEAGIPVLEALVAPENHHVIRVLRDLGFPTEIRSEPGLVRVTFATSFLPEAVERFERREALAAAAAVQTFLRPRGIAVIGASRDRETVGGRILYNLISDGFQGPVYPVNPRAPIVQSMPAYPSVLQCPDPLDLAIVAVPAPAVVPVAKECAQRGVRALVVISAGFAEFGEEGARRQQALVEVCREAGMRLIGPNCMGVVNTDPRVSMNAQFVGVTPRSGSIGFLSQSGALGIAIIAHANRLGLGMSSFVSVGNKADISGNDLIQYWEHDERTRVILLYLESFGNPRKFARITRRVARKKPIVAVKSGRSAAGFRATQSHTGALVSTSDVTVDTLFRQSGVIRVDTLGEMFDVAALLATQPVPGGDRVAVLTNGGGLGILAADACEGFGLRVPELSPQTQAALRDFLPPAAGARNPVDMMGSATPEDYGRAIEIVGHDPAVDAVIAAFVPPIAVRHEDVAAEIVRATRNLEGRVVVLSIFAGIHGDPAHLSDGDTRVPSYPFPEPAARALARAVQHGRWLATPEEPARPTPGTRCEEAVALVARALARGGGWLPPDETAALLDCHGIATVRTLRAESPEDAGRIAAEMGTKVVLKGIVPGLVHKSEAGAVRLNLVGARQVERVARDMRARLARAGVAVTGWVVQPMVPTGMEMLVGVTHDPIFGPVVACGAGGVLVELLRDVSIRLAPLTGRDVREMVRELKTFPVFTGYRGGARYDLAALEEIILRVGALAEEIPEILELDLNPVIVLPEGQGAAIVDARVRVGITPPPLPVGAKRRG